MEALINYYNGLIYIYEIFNDIENVYRYDNNIDNKYNIHDIELFLKIINSISCIYLDIKSYELNIPRIIEKYNNYTCINKNNNTYININNVNRDLGYCFNKKQYKKELIKNIIENLSYIKNFIKYN